MCPSGRFRKLVTEVEPDVQEVPRLFRSVLMNCLDEMESNAELEARASRWDNQRSKSLSFVTFRSRFRSTRGFGSLLGGSRSNLQEQAWMDEEEEEEQVAEKVAVEKRSRRGRSMSMPEIRPLGQRVQS